MASSLCENPELAVELLDALPGNDRLAARAFEEDSRIRDLGDQFDAYLGMPEEDRVVAYEDTGTDSDKLYAKLAEMTNEASFR